jgi:hypothetical protein
MSVTLDTQHAVRMLRIILSSVSCLAAPYFSKLSHQQRDVWEKKVIARKICVLGLLASFVRNISCCEKWKYIVLHEISTSYSCQLLLKLERQ